jgi:hypothetical protein
MLAWLDELGKNDKTQARATTHIKSANLHFKVSSPWCLMLTLMPRVTALTTPTTTLRYPSSPYTTSRYSELHRKRITKHRRRHAALLALTYSPGEQTLRNAEGGLLGPSVDSRALGNFDHICVVRCSKSLNLFSSNCNFLFCLHSFIK